VVRDVCCEGVEEPGKVFTIAGVGFVEGGTVILTAWLLR
jgi:hypothetical protein